MGEIAEALKRARESNPQEPPSQAPLPPPAVPTGLPQAPAPPAIALDGPSASGWHARTVLLQPEGPVAAQFRHLALRLTRVIESQGIRSLLITSASESEGKTTIACNLAIALASLRGEGRVALVDFDLRRPTVAKALNVEPERSIASAIEGRANLPECGLRVDGLALDLYLTGEVHPDPIRLISSSRTPDALADLRRSYALTIIDSPPVLPVPDVPLLQRHVDGTLLVVRAGSSRRGAFEETLATLDRERLAGVVLNQSGTALPGYYYAYHHDEKEPKSDA